VKKLSPKAAWPALVYGLPTLALRSRRQMQTALAVARFLERQPAVRRKPHLRYHGFHPAIEMPRVVGIDPALQLLQFPETFPIQCPPGAGVILVAERLEV